MLRHRNEVTSQTRTRERVRDLAEVYTHEREVRAMLDLVTDMFPSESNPRNIACTFLEPACGSGNFLVAILDRKLRYVRQSHYRSPIAIEVATLQALASIYGIDIDQSNVTASRQFLRAEIEHHLASALSTPATPGVLAAADTILATNIIWADTLKDAQDIVLVEYRWQRRPGYVIRGWSKLQTPDDPPDLFSSQTEPDATLDASPIHYRHLADYPGAVASPLGR